MLLRRSTRYQSMTAAEQQQFDTPIAELLMSDDEKDDPFGGDDDADVDYAPGLPGDASDVEDANNFDIEVETREEDPGDYPEEEVAESEAPLPLTTAELTAPITGGYSRDDRFRSFAPPPAVGRKRSHNTATLIGRRAGPKSGTISNPVSIFRSLISPEIVGIIVRETNRRANEIIGKWNAEHRERKEMLWQPTQKKKCMPI